MTEPANAAGEAARLDELAAVTREYAKFSRTAHGAALVASGAFLLATVAWDAVGHPRSFGRAVPYLLAPTVWLVLLTLCRRFYQRHGAVIEPERMGKSRLDRGLSLGLVYFFAASSIVKMFVLLMDRPGGGGDTEFLLLIAVVFAQVAVPVLAATQAGGTAELSWTVGLAGGAAWVGHILPSEGPARRIDPPLHIFRWGFVAVLGAIAVGMIVVGVRQHLAYRRIERRLAALKVPA